MDYSFSVFNKYAEVGMVSALSELITDGKMPIILCVGSDLALGDSLGPLCGTFIESKNNSGVYIYGTLKSPVTAKEIKYINSYIKSLHPDRKVIAIDAAIGSSQDIGLIKIYNKGLKPGLGADKNLNKVGDISILGIVAAKSFLNYNLLSTTRLNLVYKMADIISSALANFADILSKSKSA